MRSIDRAKRTYRANINRYIKLNSLFFAILLSSNFLSLIIYVVLPIENIFAYLFVACIIGSILNNYGKGNKTSNAVLLTVLYISLFFFTLIILVGFTPGLKEYLIYFVIVGIGSIHIATNEIDLLTVTKYIALIYFCSIVIFIQVDYKFMDTGTTMGLGYALLPGIFAGIINFVMAKKRSLWVSAFNIFIAIVYIVYLLLIASRGAIIPCIFLVFIIIYDNHKKKKMRFTLIFTIIAMISFFIYSDPLYFLLLLQEVLARLNLDVDFVNKAIRLLAEGDFLNGRIDIYMLSIYGIKDHPIVGNGIGEFYNRYLTYPHNLILHILYEGGALLALPILGITIYGIISMLFNENINRDTKYVMFLTFALAVPRLMLSSLYWREQSFWMFLALSLKVLNNSYTNDLNNVTSKIRNPINLTQSKSIIRR